jgi:site-specific DNA recombinase
VIRFAFYGRLSTTDKQDITLARPSQLRACQQKVSDLGGETTCEFFDQETGAHASRPELDALLREADDRRTRRFDAVIVFNTSRLGRVQRQVLECEHELECAGVLVHYVDGGGTKLERGFRQLMDQEYRETLKKETRRGMAQNALNGYRNGGRPPTGYVLKRVPHPVPARAAQGDYKTVLAVDPDMAGHVGWIFDRWGRAEWGLGRICDDLNRRKVPGPRHVDPARNTRGDWSKSTIRSILMNKVYLGRGVWDRLDFAKAREAGKGSPELRDEANWTISEVEHPALVSDDLWVLCQARFGHQKRAVGLPRIGKRPYLLSGMVKCATGHAPRSCYGATMKTKVYFRCDYSRSYGNEAAEAIEGHGRWCSCREDVLLPFVLDFFESRVFGAARLDLLNQQLAKQGEQADADAHQEHSRLRRQITDLDQAIERQIIAIEQGIEPELIGKRITKLKDEKATVEAALQDLPAETVADHSDLTAALVALPDLSQALRDAPPETQRAVFESFGLQITYDRLLGLIMVSATVTEAVAEALGTAELPVAAVAQPSIAGAGFEPATFGL